jgi:predicted Zn-dependent protease
VEESSTLVMVKNEHPENNSHTLSQGIMAEVLIDGYFGYGATDEITPEGVNRAFERAILQAKNFAPYGLFAFKENARPLAQDLFQGARNPQLDSLSMGEINDLLQKSCRQMEKSKEIINTHAYLNLTNVKIRYVSTSGTQIETHQQIVGHKLSVTAQKGPHIQTRSWSNATQGGLEQITPLSFAHHSERIAQEVMELVNAPNCPNETIDILVAPDQMILQIHESIGHPLELDRILGDERNYAGWSFIKKEDFGNLRYGTDLLNVTFDPSVPGELASYNCDDTGLKASKEYLIKDGILLRGLGGIESQRRSSLPGVANSRASSWNRPPIDRMANINLEPGDCSFDDLVKNISRGVLLFTNRSWSIDDFRNKFQFGCEYAKLIEDGEIKHTVKNPNYRGISVPFWNSLHKVGNRDTFEIQGTSYCGKGEPNQAIRVGHASPMCLFKNVEVFGGEA